MKTNTSKKGNAIKRLFCGVFGHDFEVSKKVTKHVKEYECLCCHKQLTTDGRGKLTELTPKFMEINAMLEFIQQKRSVYLNQRKVIAA
jgi:hypothetical protein